MSMLNGLTQFIAYQTIIVNSTTPCFLNDTAGINMLRNCGFGRDYLQAATLGFDWVTGGFFSMILVALLIGITYIKYHKAIYPLIIGIMYIPFTYFVFPNVFLTYGIVLTIVAAGVTIYYIYIHQTKEYSG